MYLLRNYLSNRLYLSTYLYLYRYLVQVGAIPDSSAFCASSSLDGRSIGAGLGRERSIESFGRVFSNESLLSSGSSPSPTPGLGLGLGLGGGAGGGGMTTTSSLSTSSAGVGAGGMGPIAKKMKMDGPVHDGSS